ncbi:MAG: tetratricopeptide repeat protein [Nitrososphaera sp.]|nr:tetratricopeptide repeat protein [Nitrososphaera sp.]MCI0706620.1 tetratricopeptide repeat protein [Ignavibacteriota bacterium]
MKPTILCGECGKPIELGSKFCNHCGKPVQWSQQTQGDQLQSSTLQCERCGAENEITSSVCCACGEVLNLQQQRTGAQRKQDQKGRKKRAEQPLVLSWKVILGFVVFIAVGVLGLELLTAKKLPDVPHTHDDTSLEPAANMLALQEIEDLEKRVSDSPSDIPLRIKLANLLHDARFYDKAIQRYNEYLKLKPDDVDARVDLGICYYEINKTTDAKREMLTALEHNKKHVLAHFNLGIVHLRIAQAEMKTGNTDQANEAVLEANEWFRKTIALDPNGSAGQRAQQLLTEHFN